LISYELSVFLAGFLSTFLPCLTGVVTEGVTGVDGVLVDGVLVDGVLVDGVLVDGVLGGSMLFASFLTGSANFFSIFSIF